jgi:uncharacterized protein (TIGR02265 family)
VSDLARRLALATSADCIRGLFLRSFQAAIRMLGDEVLLERCRRVWGHETFVDSFFYPVRLQLEVLAVVLEPLASQHGGPTRVLRMMGRQCARDFLASYTGRALRVAAGGDAKRMVAQAPAGYQFAVSGGVHTLRWMGPTRCVWSMHHDFMPVPFHEGVLLGLLEEARAQGVKVYGRQTDALDGEYDLSWL